jgi:hypothetical protein
MEPLYGKFMCITQHGKKGLPRPSLARSDYIKVVAEKILEKSEKTAAAILPDGDGLRDFFLPVSEC